MGAQISDQLLLTKGTDAMQFEVFKDRNTNLYVSLDSIRLDFSTNII